MRDSFAAEIAEKIPGMTMKDAPLIKQIIGAAIDVHKVLGSRLL